jgi:hypothetical protein
VFFTSFKQPERTTEMQIMGTITVSFDFEVEDDKFKSLKEAQEHYETFPEALYDNATGEEIELEDTFE